MSGTTKGTLYAIGSRDDGILYVLTNPIRIAKISRSTVEQHAKKTGQSYEAAFADFERASLRAISENGLGDVSESIDEPGADFRFAGEVDADSLKMQRHFSVPVHAATAKASNRGAERSLRDAVAGDIY